MFKALRCAGRRSPKASTRSTSLPIRAASAWISPVSSRSASPSPISSSCAAPEIPASGFLISCASIAAMPVTERAAERWPRLRSILSAMPCGCIRIRISPSVSCSGAACTFCSCGGCSPQPTIRSYCATETPLRRACPTTSSSALSLPTNLPSGRPAICRSDMPPKLSVAGLAVTMASSGSHHQRRVGDRAPQRLEAAAAHAAIASGRSSRPRRERVEHRVGVGQRHQPGAQRPRARDAVEVPAEVLARHPNPEIPSVEADRLGVVAADQRAERRSRWRRPPGERRRDLADHPRPPARAAADHHPVGARARQRGARRGRVEDVAVDDHRDRDRRPDPRHRVPVGGAVVERAAGAAVHRHHPHAGGLGAPGDLRRVDRAGVPAEAHLHRHRHLDGADHRLHEPQRQLGLAHQRRAGEPARHLLRRAAEVDVDDRRPLPRRPARRLGHRARLAAGELHRRAAVARAELGPRPRLRPAPQHLARGDHLGNDEPGAEPEREVPERDVGDAGHRCQKNRRVERYAP